MRILVTGAAGFIGSSISQALLQQGHDVVGIDCFIDYYPRAIKESNLKPLRDFDRFSFIEKNLSDIDLKPLLEGTTWVFHQAAQAGVRASWGDDFSIYTHNNILATQRLLEAAKGTGAKIIYASSSSVYGETMKLPMQETDMPQPMSPYGVSKLAAEHLCVLYTKNFGVPTCSLRYFTVYGPKQRPDMAFHKFCRALLEKREIGIYGNGEQTRDFTFIADAVQANLAAAEKGVPGTVYNIGGGSRISVNAVLGLLENASGIQPLVRYTETQKGDVTHTYADTSRAQHDLNFHPNYDVQRGLAEEFEWVKANLHFLQSR
jgi:nucleoside-diphosphate-sugar epimerase